MASLYRRDRSPFWWISYLDPAGKRRQESTRYRHAVTGDTRKARELARDFTESERNGLDRGEAWDAWAPALFADRYCNSPKTLHRADLAWRNIKVFLDTQNIAVPRQLTREHVRFFIRWRQIRHSELGVYEVCKNTALHEIKFLRIAMREAVIAGSARANPCEALGIPPDSAPKKPRITDAEHEKILAALKREPEWMRVSYRVAWEQGCRFSETCLHLPTQVDLDKAIIRFRTKGHKDTLAEFPLSPNLAPLFKDLIQRGRDWTYQMPQMPGKAFWRFFRKIGLSHLCFHSTRVTFVTRCKEAGFTPDECMRLVGHASYAVHKIYDRLSADHSTVKALRARL